MKCSNPNLAGKLHIVSFLTPAPGLSKPSLKSALHLRMQHSQPRVLRPHSAVWPTHAVSTQSQDAFFMHYQPFTEPIEKRFNEAWSSSPCVLDSHTLYRKLSQNE